MKYKLLILIALIALIGCRRVDNSFVIYDTDRQVSKAQLRICGSQIELKRSSDRLSGNKSINCEGEGEIVLHLSNGQTALCHISYVTPGAEQDFAFELIDTRCLPKL